MPAEAPFDPCRQWLGIDAVELGNPCRVLGVSPQEMDPAVVVRAAEARVKLLKNIAPGPFEMARTSLIARVEEARDKVLADMVANAFRGSAAGVPGSLAMPTPPSQLAGARAGTPSFAAPAAPPPPAVPPAVPAGIAGPAWPAAEGVGGAPFVIRTTTYRRRMPMGGIFVTIAALAAAAGGLLVLVTNKTPLGGKATHGDRETAGTEHPSAEPKHRKSGRPAGADDAVTHDRTADAAISTGPRAAAPPRRTERQRQVEQAVDMPRSPKPPPSTGEREMPAERVATGKPTDPEPMEKPEPRLDPKPESRDPSPAAAVQNRPAETAAMQKPAVDEKPAPAGADPAIGTTDEKMPPKAPPNALEGTFTDVLSALRQRDDAAAEKLLSTAAETATDADSKRRVEAWRHLSAYYKGFMGYREKALADVQSGDEFDVQGKKVAVVEVTDDEFKYRYAGSTKTVARDKIPGGIVMAIVTDWFDDNPANDLYLGAYHLAKPESDPERARGHWEKAQLGGADASAIMPLLRDPLFLRPDAGE